jgi:DNA-binding MarR family transcriptional regulator
MEAFDNELNTALVETFNNILKVEEEAVKKSAINLSIGEMHLIEAIDKGGNTGRSISDLANELDITLPSVTVAINKLQKKGYVDKVRCEQDKRVVYILLTRKGKKLNSVHHYFHQTMIRNISAQLTKEEKNVFIKGIKNINEFFKKSSKKEGN